MRYGAVKIIKGRHKDEIGFYEDDQNGKAIVYLKGDLLCGRYYVFPFKWLKPTNKKYVVTRYCQKQLVNG